MFMENVRIALEAIRQNRLRSVLTIVGVVIGVGSIVMILALGKAAEVEVSRSLGRLGTNMLFVYPSANPGAGGGLARSVLGERDAAELLQSVPGVRRATAQISAPVRVIVGSARADTTLRGVSPAFFDLTATTMIEGGVFADTDVSSRATKVILGRSVAERLFEGESAVGRRVRINGSIATVSGVAASSGGALSGDQSDFILMPITTARQRFGLGQGVGSDAVDMVFVQFNADVPLSEAKARTAAFLERRKHLNANSPRPFEISTTEELSRAASSVVRILQGVLGAIASISLIVGGIGITNMMLVSVTERTPEIGIRMAVGARPADVRVQFLTEAAILCALGGTIALIGSTVLILAIRLMTGLAISLAASHVLIALGMAITTGVLAGYFPARRAAELDPVEALRRE